MQIQLYCLSLIAKAFTIDPRTKCCAQWVQSFLRVRSDDGQGLTRLGPDPGRTAGSPEQVPTFSRSIKARRDVVLGSRMAPLIPKAHDP